MTTGFVLECARTIYDGGCNIFGLCDERWNENHHHSIDGRIAADDFHCLPILIGSCRCDHVNRISDARFSRQKLSEFFLSLIGKCRHFETLGRACIGAKNSRAPGVRENSDMSTFGNSLTTEQRSDVEHFFECVSTNHTGMPEKCITVTSEAASRAPYASSSLSLQQVTARSSLR